MTPPSMSQKCDDQRCKHVFGKHYSTFDGQKTGCSYYYDDQRDGGPCGCDGFKMIYRYPPPKQTPSPQSYQDIISGGQYEGCGR